MSDRAWPRAVLLDVGGVLLLPAPELVRPALGGVVASVETIDRAHYRAQAAASRGQGLDWDQYFQLYATATGVPADGLPAAVRALREVFGGRLWTRVVPGAVAMLRVLRDAGLLIALVSNADGRLEESLRELALCQVGDGPGVAVDAILDSVVVGLEKPDSRLFALALQRLGVERRDALHVGDMVHSDVDGAHAAGIPVLHYLPYGDCDPTEPPHQHLARLADLAAIVSPDGFRR